MRLSVKPRIREKRSLEGTDSSQRGGEKRGAELARKKRALTKEGGKKLRLGKRGDRQREPGEEKGKGEVNPRQGELQTLNDRWQRLTER